MHQGDAAIPDDEFTAAVGAKTKSASGPRFAASPHPKCECTLSHYDCSLPQNHCNACMHDLSYHHAAMFAPR
jgi:hypothetical protein